MQIKNLYFFNLLIFLWILAGALLLFIFDFASLHLALNRFHFPWLDFFMKYLTHLGNGIFFGLTVLFFIIKKKFRLSKILAITGVAVLLCTQVLKRLVFHEALRPVNFLDQMPGLSLPEGVELHQWFSFPSGHSASIFSLITIAAFYYNKPWQQTLLFLTGLIVAYTRVYLSQHFFHDIWAGSLIGYALAVITLYFTNPDSK
jgi:membrane-associated phospholipid phosphatase